MKTHALSTRSRRLAAVASAAALLTLTACGSDGDKAAGDGAKSSPSAPKVIEATNGKITVPADVKRIVTVSYATGALLDLGVQPVGTSTLDENNPVELLPAQKDAAAKIEPIGSGIEINIEKVASLKPDLIIVEGATAFDWGVKKLEGIAPTLYFGVDKPVDLLTAQEKIATAVGRDAEFKKLKGDYEAKAAKIKADYAGKLNTVKWSFASSYGGGEFLVDTSSSWVGRVLKDSRRDLLDRLRRRDRARGHLLDREARRARGRRHHPDPQAGRHRRGPGGHQGPGQAAVLAEPQGRQGRKGRPGHLRDHRPVRHLDRRAEPARDRPQGSPDPRRPAPAARPPPSCTRPPHPRRARPWPRRAPRPRRPS